MKGTEIAVFLTKDKRIFKACAKLMAESDPWKKLNRNLHNCLDAFSGDFKEVHVAMDNNTIVGFAILQMAGVLKGYIQSIMVTEEFRGKGIGTALLSHCENRIFENSPNVFICVSSFNAKATKLYLKLGYRKVGEFKNFIIHGHSENLLRKTLGPLSEFIPQ